MEALALRAIAPVGEGTPRQGSSLLELVVAVAVLMTGLLAFSRSLSDSIALGEANRQTALATAAAQSAVEQLYAAEGGRAFALYNDDPDDDPDGSGTAPGSRFSVTGLETASGRIFFPADEGSPGVLREDLVDARLFTPLDLDLDGTVDGDDHSGDYVILPARVRVEWQDHGAPRELEVTTIVGTR